MIYGYIEICLNVFNKKLKKKYLRVFLLYSCLLCKLKLLKWRLLQMQK